MIVRTNIYNNFFACFDEARGIAMHRDSVISNHKSKCLSYMETKLFSFIIMLVLCLLLSFLGCFACSFKLLSQILYTFACLYFAVALITILRVYNYRKFQRFESSVVIDRHGITDESYYGIKMIFSWDKIKGVVVGKNTVVFLTDTPCYFYFNITELEKIVKLLTRYGQKRKIII